MLSADGFIILASVVTLVYFFIAETYKLVKNKSWVLLVVLALLIGIIIWVLYKSWKTTTEETSDKEDTPDIKEDNVKETDIPQSRVVPEEFESTENKFDFGISDGKVDSSEITYEKFKGVYLTPSFINKFTDSIGTSLKLKAKKYKELKIKISQELEAFTGKKEKKETLADILSMKQNEMVNMLKSTLKQIDEILIEIRSRLSKISEDTTRINLVKCLTDPKNGLDSLTGRDEIKDFMALRLYTFAMNPRIFFNGFQNIALYAGSGYGKTKIAQVIGHVYTTSGILIVGHFISTTKAGLVSAYVNETANKTRSVLLSTLESVLFIDEAYDITPPPNLLGHGVDHGHEAITELVNFIDKMIGLNIIIVAGYEDEMEERFMKANQGLERRFLPPITLEPYTDKQLTSILIRFLQDTNPDLILTQDQCNYIYSLISWLEIKDSEVFKLQAGAVQNLSGDIATCIYGTSNVWPDNDKYIIRRGFNKFLAHKGISITDGV